MKRTLRLLTVVLAMVAMLPLVSKAQQMPPMGVDSLVRIGKLDNGLTYYIRHNEYPKGQADFYIAQKVGSIQEEDSQRGLAHFLEHMCFNGTTHFPGKNLINWLESVGVKFGQNLNAYTSIDQTVYNISNVPVQRTGVQDSCLLILHDWANDLLLLPEEIEAERGVIHEEWRQSMVGQMRILEQLLPTIYPGDKYGYRLPIGTMEVVDNFEPKEIRDYYEKWYRPDLQGIIVVGDIDVDRTEAKIKEMFADITMPENPAERVYFPVNDTQGTIYAIGHDKEQQQNIAELMIKTEALPREYNNTMARVMTDYITEMICDMLDTRLNDISSKPNAPFAAAGASYGEFFLAKTKDALTLFTMGKDSNLAPAVAATYRELLRAVRGGFTQTEYERARAEYISKHEKAYNNRNQRENKQFVNEYVNNFLDNTPIPSMEEMFNTRKQIAQMIPVEVINQTLAALVTPDNRVLLVMTPDVADGNYPTKEQFEKALSEVEAENIEAYKEELKSEPLIPTMPAKGSIVSEHHNDQWNADVWTLSNGATVIVKPTKFKEDEILFSATALNGTSAYGAEYANSLTFMPVAMNSYGLGTYTDSDLTKYLSGKQASLKPSFGLYTRTFSGNTTPKDLKTLMELIYMGFTDMNFDADEFEALKSTYEGVLHNQEANPQYIFSKKLQETIYNSPRIKALSVDAVKGANREQLEEVTSAMTANAADYTFTFVGNIDEASLRPLVEEYIASIPGNATTARKSIEKLDPQYEIIPGSETTTYTAPMETPQTFVCILESGSLPYNIKNEQLGSIAGQIISKRLLDKVREEMGAVYSIWAQGDVDGIGTTNASIQSAFPMKPEMKEETLKAIKAIFDDAKVNIDQTELDKAKEFMTKNFTEGKEKNGPWMSGINNWLRTGEDTFNENLNVLNTITVDDVKAFMNDLSNQGNYRVVVLDPEAK